jgi:O-acetylhomoserine/O-acetylserine sulfhydrylase-like pyridoxal-dependent enzyme
MTVTDSFNTMRQLSPRRNTSDATSVVELVREQLAHFAIDPESGFGRTLAQLVLRMYECQADVDRLWQLTLKGIHALDESERIARFNAKKFLAFQLAKLLDNLQQPFRRSYQALQFGTATQLAKGPYPIFDNITAIFSATPVIARTATYIYACAEWIEDAFSGKELMLEIYSRLLNPTSISLANYIVDLEAGPYAGEYLAWNFNSGMAAIDATLSHLLGRDDVIITSRNIYGGSHQLIHDWYAKAGNLEVAVEAFDGFTVDDFDACWQRTRQQHQARFEAGRKAYLFIESPCNPHGYVLDVPGICRRAHQLGLRVMLDSTVGTPFLSQPLQRADLLERPDFLIHSYTKDLSGTGSVIAGCVIGRNEDMFLPKGERLHGRSWDETMFWNVYYVKGAFLNADAAFEVIQGIRTLDVRMLRKCVNTQILARFLDAHPGIRVHCNALDDNPNSKLRATQLFLGLPAPLFTIDLGEISRGGFQRFFDSLSPTFDHMISLGQSNTIVACPSLTTHSELDREALAAAGLTPTTIRFAVGDEDPLDLISHIIHTARITIDPEIPGFSSQFPDRDEIVALIRECYVGAHTRYIDQQLRRSGSNRQPARQSV